MSELDISGIRDQYDYPADWSEQKILTAYSLEEENYLSTAETLYPENADLYYVDGEDDTRIFTAAFQPEGEVVDTIIWPHGMGQNSYLLKDIAQFYTDRGIRFVCHDMRGHGGTIGNLDARTENLVHIESANQYGDDLHSVIMDTRQRYEIADDQTLIMGGHSTGFVAAQNALAHNGNTEMKIREPIVMFSPLTLPDSFAIGGIQVSNHVVVMKDTVNAFSERLSQNPLSPYIPTYSTERQGNDDPWYDQDQNERMERDGYGPEHQVLMDEYDAAFPHAKLGGITQSWPAAMARELNRIDDIFPNSERLRALTAEDIPRFLFVLSGETDAIVNSKHATKVAGGYDWSTLDAPVGEGHQALHKNPEWAFATLTNVVYPEGLPAYEVPVNNAAEPLAETMRQEPVEVQATSIENTPARDPHINVVIPADGHTIQSGESLQGIFMNAMAAQDVRFESEAKQNSLAAAFEVVVAEKNPDIATRTDLVYAGERIMGEIRLQDVVQKERELDNRKPDGLLDETEVKDGLAAIAKSVPSTGPTGL